jgi:hypothetical protein
MRLSTWVKGLCVPVALLCATSAGAAEIEDTLKAIQQQIDALKQQGKYTVNEGSLAIESWLLTSTAIDSTAEKIHRSVANYVKAPSADATKDDEFDEPEPEGREVLVVTAAEQLEFGQAAMMKSEIAALNHRLASACGCEGPSIAMESVPAVAIAGAIAGLLKSETQLDAIEQTVDATLLAAAVAARLPNAIVPSAAIAGDGGGALIGQFNRLVSIAEQARAKYDALPQAEKEKATRLKNALDQYDKFYDRVTTANDKGVVPIVLAARLHKLIENDPYVLRVNTEKAGGTLLKRTNVVTALGGESVFVSGGLVSSYQLTDPRTGKMIGAGVVTCRTTLTSLKRVQNASWRAQASMRTTDGRIEPAAICSP